MGVHAQVLAATEALFGPQINVAVSDPRQPQPPLMAGEADAVANAVPARQSEFAAGRAAARRAMAACGAPSSPILAGPDRAPIWPEEWTGSLSHTADICIAALARRDAFHGIGVDIEAATPLDEDLIASICSKGEIAGIAAADLGRYAKRIFCAKEAAYKAQYALTGLLFGFDHLEVRFGDTDGCFTVRFLKPAPPFAVGDTLPGRIKHVAGYLVTTVAIGQGAVKVEGA